MPAVKGETLEERFWFRVEKTDSCWLWLGSRNQSGRGQLKFDGKQLVASRIAYEMMVGEISDDLGVCHTCDNPSCVNPDHLFLGDQRKNMRDCVSKKRNKAFPGSLHSNSKLTEEIVLECRRRFVPWCQTNGNSALAKEFGVTDDVMRKAIKGRSWSHI